MAIVAYPFENTDTTETQYARLFQELQDPGVVGSFGTASLAVSANSSAMAVTVNLGILFARGFILESTTGITRPIAAADTQPRIDTVVGRFDPANNTADIVVLKGAPAATPSAPALTQTETGVYEVALADVSVASGAVTIAAANVTDRRPWVGHRVGVWSTQTRPLQPRLGRLGLNTTRGVFEHYNGASWVDLAPIVTWSSIDGKPATFAPTLGSTATTAKPGNWLPSWTDVQSKPATFPATLGFGAADAKPGNWAPSWGDVSGKPAAYPPSGHTHDVTNVYWGPYQLNVYLGDVFATKADMNWTNSNVTTAQQGVNNLSAGKVNAWGDINTARYSEGPTPGAYNRSVGAGYFSVYMDNGHQWGRNVSSRRYKDAIEPAEVDVAAVLALEPVTYHRIGDEKNPDSRDLGLIAEDSTGVDHLVIWDVERDAKGEALEGSALRPESVRYETVLPVALLAVVKAQEARIRDLEDAVSTLLNRKG